VLAPPSLRSLPLLLVVALVAGGCSLRRYPLSARGGASIDGGRADAGSRLDAGATIDAPVSPIDAGPACAPSCTGGRECVAGACVCPEGACCPSCTGTSSCVAGSCVEPPPCGAIGEPCCASAPTCDFDADCSGSGVCEAFDCGASGEACCASERCDPGYVCVPDRLFEPAHCEPCGRSGQACCNTIGVPACDYDDLACDPIGSICRSCGGRGDPCCTDGCDSGEVCPAWGYC
jgi:hypothetical protein